MILAPVLWINRRMILSIRRSWGFSKRMVKRDVTPQAKFVLIPISDATRGHGTHTVAAMRKNYLAEFMRETEAK